MITLTSADGENNRRLPFSSNFLKLVAVVSMLCDHFSVAFITSDMNVWRWIGRIGFPVFCFLIAEGASKTKNIRRYLLRLILFAFLSEIPFDLMNSGEFFYLKYQNVFFTLSAGLFSIWMLQLLQKKGGLFPLLSVIPLFLVTVGCLYLCTDYKTGGALSIFLFYLASQTKEKPELHYTLLLAAIFAPCLSYYLPLHKLYWNKNEMGAVFALPLLLLYNGERGKVKINKYVFYAIYPAHLLLFAVIKIMINR